MKAFTLVVLLIIATSLVACGPSQAELDAQATQIAADEFATQTAQAPTATPSPIPPTPGPGPAFDLGEVMKIPDVAQPVGDGTCRFSEADEPGMILTTINGLIPVVNGETCICCVDQIHIGPNLRVPLAPFFGSREQPGTSMFFDFMQLKGPMAHESGKYIVSGPDGASLKKVGAGFRLVSGLAFYVEE